VEENFVTWFAVLIIILNMDERKALHNLIRTKKKIHHKKEHIFLIVDHSMDGNRWRNKDQLETHYIVAKLKGKKIKFWIQSSPDIEKEKHQ